MGFQAFASCIHITQVNYNATNCADVTSSANPFEGCSGTLNIGSNVQRIPAYMFYEGSGFTGTLTIPASVTSIGTSAFKNCTGFTQVKFNAINCADNSTYATKPFEGCGGTLTIGSSVQRIPAFMFYQCSGFTGSLSIPNSVTTIGNFAFYGCSGFNSTLTIGNSVTTIGNSAFRGCSGFTGSLAIPNSVTTIGASTFRDCSGFTGSLTIGNSVTTIDDSAFYGCTGFTGSLTIGSAMTSINSYAFYNCAGFTSMTAFPETPPTISTFVFSMPRTIPVYVPCIALEDYQAAWGWSSFTNMQCRETLTVYDGTSSDIYVPAYITYFDNFTRSQFVIPASDLVEMAGTPITSMTFYTTSANIPYTTVSSADVYLKEVNYTTISAYESKASATTVYSGYFNIISTGDGGEMTILFSTPYTYNGGNLLVGIENTENSGWKIINFYGQTVTGASISDKTSSSTGTIPATQRNFIPKTTFGFYPTCEPKSLPYTYGFEEEDEFECWTMLRSATYTGRSSYYSAHEGDYYFQFCYNTDPPQYLISPKFEGTTGVDVSFYYKNGSDYWPETFQVGYSTTTKSPSAFTWHEEVTANDYSTWKLYEDYFPEGTKYVAVRYNSYDMNQLFLDDFSFTPAFCPPEDRCELTFTLTDSWGDTWNGNAIRVVDVETGIVLATMTNVTNDHANAPITETYTLPVCDGRELSFEWVMGTYNSYPYECSYTITSASGMVVLQGTGNSSMSTGDVLGTYTMNCDAVVQTIALTAGWNWMSLSVEMNPAEALAMLEQGLGGNGLMIKARNGGYVEYDDEEEEWFGSLTQLTNENMYMIWMATACTVELEGTPANPANHAITINPGWNWIGFPSAEEVNVAYALASFVAEEDDRLKSRDAYTEFDGDEWFGTLTTLVPGQGYMYYSYSDTPKTLIYNTHEYVDLGLPSGLLWATCNVGATSPEDYGDYFAWGETTPKDTYNWSTYQYCNGAYNTLTKYCTNADYGNNGFVDNLTTLFPEDDAATANWGSGWRMPTKEEWQELRDNTTVTWTTQNGVNGRLFTASNGNSLFLPAAGYRSSSSLTYAGSYGGYWSRSLSADYPDGAWSFGFTNGGYGMSSLGRYCGFTVRPVCSSPQN